MFVPCGCVICKAELGESVNQLNIDGYSPNEIIEFLRNENLIISKKVLQRHLSAYDMMLNSENVEIVNDSDCVPIDINMGNFDFSKYRFNENEANEIIEYLQKLHLKIHLNQCEILLKNQDDVLTGRCKDVSSDSLRNIAVSWKMLTDVSGIRYLIDINAAIDRISREGYKIISDDSQ